jgi:NADPH:quinone reductase-like Zn-dependent oxidoreductase
LRDTRLAVWQRIATDLAPRHLDQIVTRTLDFEQLPQAFQVYLDGAHSGRTLVRIGGDPA